MSRLATLYDEQQQPVGLYTHKSRESDLLEAKEMWLRCGNLTYYI